MHAAAGGVPRALERPEAGATTAEAFAFKKEIQALARMARQTMAAIEWRDTGAS
jgi:hypothetical protein